MGMTPLQRFWNLLKVYRSELREIYGYAIFNGLINLSLPLGIQAIVTYLQTGEVTSGWFVLVFVVLGGIALTGTLQVLQLKVVENIQQDIFARSGIEFAYRIPKIQAKEIRDKYFPELANRFFDTLTIQKGLPKILIDFSLASFQVIFGLILLTIYSPYFMFLLVFLFVLLYIIIAVTGPKGLETSIKESKQKYRLAHLLEDVARSFISFKQFSHEKMHLKKADDIVVDYLSARKSHFRILLRQFMYFVGFKVFVAAGLLLLGGVLVINNQMNIGQFVAAEIVILLIINSMEKLIRVVESIYDVLTALEKIGTITDFKLDEPSGLVKTAKANTWDIDAKEVSYRYPGDTVDALRTQNFKVCCKDRILINGEAGSGKSTLQKLLAGTAEATTGQLLINKVPMRNFERRYLNENIGVLYPSSQLIAASFLENITMGREIAQDRIDEVLEKLYLFDFIQQQPKGIKTEINSTGEGLPANVTDKLLLARAIVNNPKLLLLDNPIANVNKDVKIDIARYLTSASQNWVLFVSSDESIWSEVCNKTIEL